jgi:hypothetical protein
MPPLIDISTAARVSFGRPASSARAIADWWLEGLPRGARGEACLASGGRTYTAREVHREIVTGTELGQALLGLLDRHYRRRPHLYRVLRGGETVESRVPALYGGYRKDKIFGRLDCRSGLRMKSENRVFFLSLHDAREAGYRCCKNCKPERGAFSADVLA